MELIKQTCLRLAAKEILFINDIVKNNDARPMIEIDSSPVMKDKWLYDTGAGLTCMSSKVFRSIPID